MIRGIIYKYTSPSNKVYIGQTINEEKRKREHKDYSYSNRDNMPFHAAIRKYGFESFLYEVVYEGFFNTTEESTKKLNEMEQYFIKKYDSYNTGYNATKGGDSVRGYKWTEKARENHSKRVYKPHTEETKRSISETLTGKKQSQETKDKRSQTLYDMNKGKEILQYSMDGSFIAEYPSAKRAAEILGFSTYANIHSVCKGDRKSAFGFIWKYKHYKLV